MKISELSGELLNVWVAKALGHNIATIKQGDVIVGYQLYYYSGDTPRLPDYSTDWSDGGPVIERDRIGVMPVGIEWKAWAISDMDATAVGIEPLVAAMRAFVGSKYGVEVPDEVKL